MNIESVIEFLKENDFEEIEYKNDKNEYNINVSYYFDEDEVSAAEYCNNGEKYSKEEYVEFLQDIADGYVEEVVEEIEEEFNVTCSILNRTIDLYNVKAKLTLHLSI